MDSTTVTLSDCAKALSSLEQEIEKVKREKTSVERRLEALRTQHAMIRQLVHLL